MLKEKKFGVISLGCDKNRVDTEKMLGMIQERGYAVTDDASNANILIVNRWNTHLFQLTARAK